MWKSGSPSERLRLAAYAVALAATMAAAPARAAQPPTLELVQHGDFVLASRELAVKGGAEPRSLVAMVVDRRAPVTAFAAEDGSFAIPVHVSEGEHELSVTAADAAGNVSPAATAVFFVDATAPTAPVVATPRSGAVLGSGEIEIAGTAEPGAIVAVALDGGVPVPADVAADGSFRVPVGVSEGAHHLSVTAEDAAANVSPEVALAFAVRLSGDGTDAGGSAAALPRTGGGCRQGAAAMPLAIVGFVFGIRRRRKS